MNVIFDAIVNVIFDAIANVIFDAIANVIFDAIANDIFDAIATVMSQTNLISQRLENKYIYTYEQLSTWVESF